MKRSFLTFGILAILSLFGSAAFAQMPPPPPPFPPPGQPWPPGQPGMPDDGRACFYDNTDFNGASFCLRNGDSIRDLQGWSRRIVSVDLSGNASVTLCKGVRFTGDCLNLIWGVTDLRIHGDWANAAQSVRVVRR